MTEEEFAALPQERQQQFRTEHARLEERMQHVFATLRDLDEQAHERISTLDLSVAHQAIDPLAASLAQKYGNDEKIVEYIHHLAHDMCVHADVLHAMPLMTPQAALERGESADQAGLSTSDGAEANNQPAQNAFQLQEDLRERPAMDLLSRRYRVNVFVAHQSSDHAPIEQEINPDLVTLIGRIEFGMLNGLPYTDHLLIKPGTFHRANGGYLIVQAHDLLSRPYAWEAIKRVLRFGIIPIESNTIDGGNMIGSASLRPEPIPAEIKAILIGNPETYAALLELDPDFSTLFKVRADFETDMPRTDETEQFYARFVASRAENAKQMPLTVDAVAAIIEEGSRWAGDQDRLSSDLSAIEDLTGEACYLAAQEHAPATRDHVLRAIAARERRLSLVSDSIDVMMNQGAILIDTTGSVVGQINGLTVMEVGTYAFGKPARITARTSPGMAGIVNFERETMMSGPAHSKGILILSGYLVGRYAQNFPLSVAGSICFEQIYGGIEGDSASSAELYALLSSLANAPITQSLAVTGSVNQMGEIQAVGGVTQKVEGFFLLCQKRGLTGEQGVIIPRANARHLMLRPEVVAAVRAGRFHVYAVKTIDEGIALLTGVPAGTPDEHGEYPPQSINRRVAETLRAYAESIRAFPTHRFPVAAS